ncbi:MAG: RND family transporter [Gammaproteobacteria bacterium]|nr:RND family transporter [Gammaproteobacteria bacterium]
MLWSATALKVDAGFNKLLPLEHPYMKTFVKYQTEFGGANRILIAITVDKGDIFTPEFFNTLKNITDEVFFIPGVDRSQVKSLFTPNVRFIEIVEDGFAGGNVIPADFQGTKEDLIQVRKNILKSGQVGRLVANDFSGAMITAGLLERDPTTGERINYQKVAQHLEDIRQKHETASIHIIGFAKVIGDITEGAQNVLMFFAIAFIITGILVYLYSLSLWLTALPLLTSLTAVSWQLGLLPLLGFGIDPMSILVPFLVFAIGVSHGVQMINSMRSEILNGASSKEAAKASFQRLLVPGGIALASDTVGFLTILLIKIEMIQEMAITASIGVAVIILTNLFLLPVLLSYLPKTKEKLQLRLNRRVERLKPFWHKLSAFTVNPLVTVTIIISLLLLVAGLWKGSEIEIGDLEQGVPELRSDSRYNIDSAIITDKFSIGVDILTVIAETRADGCIDYDTMSTIDRFNWHIQNIAGVQSVISLPTLAKLYNAGWNEGNPKWQVLPRNQQVLVQAVTPVDTSTGLLNEDCSAMPVLIFTSDHKATTIARIVDAVKEFEQNNTNQTVHFRLASGNVGVMAATNEVVAAAQFPMLLYVYGAIITLCLITFRSLRATLCIVAPLGLVSALAYALMTVLGIGLKVSTLPVVALGVGIGVDYGIYIFNRLHEQLDKGMSLRDAYEQTLNMTGNAVLFTGLTLGIGVFTWIFSDLQFQVDMGILLTFMFLLNMIAAITVLPALAALLYRKHS